MWKSSAEINSELPDLPDPQALAEFFGLSECWDNAIYPDKYEADPLWPDLIVPTEIGLDYISRLKDIEESVPAGDFYLALFAKFFHHDVIFDWQSSNVEGILELLQRELLDQRIRFPLRFGRLLYDRFNDLNLAADRTDHLLSQDVQTLIAGTPQGVYQLNHLLIGPLGALKSQEIRFLPPSLSVPLWHCSDTGCGSLHQVRLIPPSIQSVNSYRAITSRLEDEFGPPSEWDAALQWFLPRRSRPTGRKYYDLPVLISDCLVGSDLASLLASALSSEHSPALRAAITLPPRDARVSSGSGEQVAARFCAEEQLQLLLLLQDVDLVRLIDREIESGNLTLPLGQVRRARQFPPKDPFYSKSDLSALGIRSVESSPIVNLNSCIMEAYEDENASNELAWRLRASPSVPLADALSTFVRTQDVSEVVSELILGSQSVTRRVCDTLDLSVESMTGDDGMRVDRLLWKLGFNPPQFEDFLPRLQSRLRHFSETLIETTPIESENDRERIRASGVNLFVSVEDFLDRLVTYNIWVLASDHFVDSRFVFSMRDARRTISSLLGDSLQSGEQQVYWNSQGENTLGTLVRYVGESATWMKGLETTGREALLRPRSDLPFFEKDPLRRFPFYHLQLWADSDLDELRRYVDRYCSIVKLIEQADLATIRNGLDHSRDATRFPNGDNMLACVSRLREALEIADVNRYITKVFWLETKDENRFGNIEYTFQDYSQRPLVLHGPCLVSGLPAFKYQRPYLIAPGNLIGGPNAQLSFTLREEDQYEEYWRDYPKRRHIPSLQSTNTMGEAGDEGDN